MQQGWVEVLRSLFRRTDAAPPPITGGFVALGLDVPDEMPRVEILDDRTIALVYDTADVPERTQGRGSRRAPPGILRNERIRRVEDDLWGVTFGIEYTDGRGNVTTRRITLRELYRADDGTLYLHSFCHERQANRSFRFDRILSVIDLDGVVHPPRTFFEYELRVSVEDSISRVTRRPAEAIAPPTQQIVRPACAPTRTNEKPGVAQRRAARNGLRVLVALGRADGLLDDTEVTIILDYLIERAAADAIETADEDRAALLPYLRRQYPPAVVLDECVGRLASESPENRRLFLRHAAALIDADGVQHPKEFDMLLSIRDQL